MIFNCSYLLVYLYVFWYRLAWNLVCNVVFPWTSEALLCQAPECWDYRYKPLYSASAPLNLWLRDPIVELTHIGGWMPITQSLGRNFITEIITFLFLWWNTMGKNFILARGSREGVCNSWEGIEAGSRSKKLTGHIFSHTAAETVDCKWDKAEHLQSPLQTARLYLLKSITTPNGATNRDASVQTCEPMEDIPHSDLQRWALLA